jgi:integrase
MAQLFNRLTALDVQRLGPGLHADGGNLFLQVRETGARSWIFRYQRAGRVRDMGLGSTGTFSLSEARQRARRARQLLADGVDPLQQREGARAEQEATTVTLKEEALAYIATYAASWRSPKSEPQWKSSLEQYVFPLIGAKPVAEIDVKAVSTVLTPIWASKTETGHRVRQRLERILSRAISQGHHKGPNPAKWKGVLEHILPARRRVSPVVHHAAIDFDDLPSFMLDVRAREETSARAMELLILTAARTSEVIEARWEEFDLDAATWTLPGSRTKAGRPHTVALPKPALAVLRGLEPQDAGLLFPGRDASQAISNGTLLALLKRMKRSDITAHGMRAAFRSWGAERTNFPAEILELALGHAVSDQTIAAYQRSDLLDRRRKLMDAWSSFLGSPKSKSSGSVITLERKRVR